MKPLTKEQLEGFTQMISATRDYEINCAECVSLAAEFAEREQAGAPVKGALAKVGQHLRVCPECREELEALKKILKAQK